jgi:3-hydroxy-9,10-secoandrosta-1,3,5(10)-triene-9,17-dione monooxygenase
MLPTADGEQEPGTLLVPNADLEIIDTWRVGGLRGTGSKDVVVNDAFVPDHRTHRHMQGYRCDNPGNAVNDGPLYRLPFGQVFIRAVNGSAIGALRGLADAVTEYASKRVSPFGGKTSDNSAAQMAVAEAYAAVAEMKQTMRRNYAVLEGYISRGEVIPTADRLLFKYQAANSSTRAADLASKLYRVVGGTGLFTTYAFARMYDDILAARQHQFNQDGAFAENYGAFMLGRENNDFFI